MQDKQKKTEMQTASELEKFKAVAFYLAKVHRVKPEGVKLEKSEKEIDDMSLATIEHMAANIDKKIFASYQAAEARKKKN